MSIKRVISGGHIYRYDISYSWLIKSGPISVPEMSAGSAEESSAGIRIIIMMRSMGKEKASLPCCIVRAAGPRSSTL